MCQTPRSVSKVLWAMCVADYMHMQSTGAMTSLTSGGTSEAGYQTSTHPETHSCPASSASPTLVFRLVTTPSTSCVPPEQLAFSSLEVSLMCLRLCSLPDHTQSLSTAPSLLTGRRADQPRPHRKS